MNPLVEDLQNNSAQSLLIDSDSLQNVNHSNPFTQNNSIQNFTQQAILFVPHPDITINVEPSFYSQNNMIKVNKTEKDPVPQTECEKWGALLCIFFVVFFVIFLFLCQGFYHLPK